MSEVCHGPFLTFFVLFVDSASEGLPERVFSTFPLSPYIALHARGEKESTEPLSFSLDRYNSPGYSLIMDTIKTRAAETVPPPGTILPGSVEEESYKAEMMALAIEELREECSFEDLLHALASQAEREGRDLEKTDDASSRKAIRMARRISALANALEQERA